MYKVALVDDEPWNLKGLEQLADWNRLGFEIVYAGTKSTKAAEYLNSIAFHVLIADIRMPKLSGIELIRRIRARERGIVCIVVSGYAEFQYAQEALQEGVFDYCLKPVKQQTLMGLLERVKAKLDGEREERIYYFDDYPEFTGASAIAALNRRSPERRRLLYGLFGGAEAAGALSGLPSTRFARFRAGSGVFLYFVNTDLDLPAAMRAEGRVAAPSLGGGGGIPLECQPRAPLRTSSTSTLCRTRPE
ncbi:MAG: response regulator [Clostridiales bacterium]|jgi:DNA-binding NarL/FixJ family response regulator|nr:response regulator [Clostridiales bacterium]